MARGGEPSYQGNRRLYACDVGGVSVQGRICPVRVALGQWRPILQLRLFGPERTAHV